MQCPILNQLKDELLDHGSGAGTVEDQYCCWIQFLIKKRRVAKEAAIPD